MDLGEENGSLITASLLNLSGKGNYIHHGLPIEVLLVIIEYFTRIGTAESPLTCSLGYSPCANLSWPPRINITIIVSKTVNSLDEVHSQV